MPAKGIIEFADLQAHFHLPMAEVARRFGVCTTFFKKMCRIHGIRRWPYRKLKSLQKKIIHLQQDDSCSKVHTLEQRLEEFRQFRPWTDSSQMHDAKSEGEGEEACTQEFDEPEASGADVDMEEEQCLTGVEECVCHALASLRHSQPLRNMQEVWSPSRPMESSSQRQPKRSMSPRSRGSESSGATVPSSPLALCLNHDSTAV